MAHITQKLPPLTIVIPTYNRAGFLDRCLGLLFPAVEAYGIHVHIQDNASPDKTLGIAEKWIQQSPLISYNRNKEDIGPDRNFERALKAAKTPYVWLLGDTYTISPEGILRVLRLLKEREETPLDAMLVNANGRVQDIEANTYSSPKSLLLDLGWHATLLSSLIYSRSLIHHADFERYYDTNFIQTGILFEALARKEVIHVAWVPSVSIENIVLEGIPKRSWEHESITIWLQRWPAFVLSLPPIYPLEEKLRVIKAHNEKTNVFGFGLLYTLKRHSFPTIKALLQLGPLGRIAAPRGLILRAVLVRLVPEALFKAIKHLRDARKGHANGN